MALEQTADHDDQGEAQEQSGDLPAAALRHRHEQRIADGDRIGELDQPVGAPRQERNVRRTEYRGEIERHHADEPGECLGLDLVAPAPQQDQPGNAGRRGRERHLGRDLHGVVGVEAEQEQADQGAVEPVETKPGRRSGLLPIDGSEAAMNFVIEGVVHHPSVSTGPIPVVFAASGTASGGHLMTRGWEKPLPRGVEQAAEEAERMIHALLQERAAWWEPAYGRTVLGGQGRFLETIYFRISIGSITGHIVHERGAAHASGGRSSVCVSFTRSTDQCDISEHRSARPSRSLVTPPSTHSRWRLWP